MCRSTLHAQEFFLIVINNLIPLTAATSLHPPTRNFEYSVYSITIARPTLHCHLGESRTYIRNCMIRWKVYAEYLADNSTEFARNLRLKRY